MKEKNSIKDLAEKIDMILSKSVISFPKTNYIRYINISEMLIMLHYDIPAYNAHAGISIPYEKVDSTQIKKNSFGNLYIYISSAFNIVTIYNLLNSIKHYKTKVVTINLFTFSSFDNDTVNLLFNLILPFAQENIKTGQEDNRMSFDYNFESNQATININNDIKTLSIHKKLAGYKLNILIHPNIINIVYQLLKDMSNLTFYSKTNLDMYNNYKLIKFNVGNSKVGEYREAQFAVLTNKTVIEKNKSTFIVGDFEHELLPNS